MRSSSAFGRGLGGVLLMMTVLACGATPPPPSGGGPGSSQVASGPPAVAGVPVSATNQADGLIVTLALSADRVAAGDRIRLRVSALNAGLGPVTYMAGGCGPIETITIDGPPVDPVPVGNPPQGTSGADVLALARWASLPAGGLDWIRTPGLPDDAMMGCDASLRYEDIDPGATFSDEAVWIARTGDNLPAPGGDYTFRLEFPFVGRVAAADVGPDPAVTPIPVEVGLVVEGGPAVAVDAAAAVDAAMADPAVLAWAEQSLTRERLTGATISFVDGAWRWQIRYEGGQTEVIVDATTGEVIERRLGP
jgi:hypothetical protein